MAQGRKKKKVYTYSDRKKKVSETPRRRLKCFKQREPSILPNCMTVWWKNVWEMLQRRKNERSINERSLPQFTCSCFHKNCKQHICIQNAYFHLTHSQPMNYKTLLLGQCHMVGTSAKRLPSSRFREIELKNACGMFGAFFYDFLV